MKFLKSTDYMTNLIILNQIEKESCITQSLLAQSVGLSPARVNSYIKQLSVNQYITMDGNNKNKLYQITAKGINWRKYLLVSYMAELIDLSTAASEQIRTMLLSITEGKQTRVLLYGAGETGRVCARVIREMSHIKIIGFIDDNQQLQKKKVIGFKVFSLVEAVNEQYDKIIITSFACDLDIKRQLVSVLPEHRYTSLTDAFGASG